MTFRIGSLMVACSLVALAHAGEDQCFDSAGVKIRYVVEGKGEPVVLVHGFTSSIQREWQRTGVLASLSKNYQVIALDDRGHGKSDKPLDPKQYGVEMAKDVVRLMDHRKIQKAHLVGYSMGGLITEYILVNYPDRLITATIGGMGWIRADDQRMALTGALAVVLENGNQIDQFVTRLRSAGKPSTDNSVSGPLSALRSNDTKALAACARSLPELGVKGEQLKANRIPTLAIIGGNDALKVFVDDLKGIMPSLKVTVLEGADHDSALKSAKFAEEINAFLASHTAKPVANNAGQDPK